MLTSANIIETPTEALLERSVCEMTRRIAGIDLTRTFFSESEMPDWASFIIRIAGDYEAALILSAEKEFFYEVTRRMKKIHEVSIKDIVVYVTEYYNILCGFFISHLNNCKHVNARFGIPEFNQGQTTVSDQRSGCITCLQYKSLYGKLQISGYGLPT